MSTSINLGACWIGLAATFILGLGSAMAQTNGAKSNAENAGAARYQSFGYNSQLKQCATPAACGIHGAPKSSQTGGVSGQNSGKGE